MWRLGGESGLGTPRMLGLAPGVCRTECPLALRTAPCGCSGAWAVVGWVSTEAWGGGHLTGPRHGQVPTGPQLHPLVAMLPSPNSH